MSFRTKLYEDDSDARPKRVRPQNLDSPGYLESDLPSQLGLIRVREELPHVNVSHDVFVRPIGRLTTVERQAKVNEAEDMDIDHPG